MKKYLFLLLVICISKLMALNVSASNSTFDYGVSTAIDGGGNVYVTGGFTSSTITFGTTTLTNAASGYYDIFIVKYDASGTVLWAKSAGGSLNDDVSSVATDGSGNVYVTGGFLSPTINFGGIILTNSKSGTSDMFIVKYDANGNVLWAKSAGGSNNDAGFSIATDGGEYVYVMGIFRSPSITFGTITLNNINLVSDNMFMVKYDVNGNVIGATSTGGSGSYSIAGIAKDESGNVYMTGNFIGLSITFGTTTLYSMGSDNIFIVKYDTSGNVLWARSAGGNGSEFLSNRFAIDGIGDVYVTGGFFSSSITF